MLPTLAMGALILGQSPAEITFRRELVPIGRLWDGLARCKDYGYSTDRERALPYLNGVVRRAIGDGIDQNIVGDLGVEIIQNEAHWIEPYENAIKGAPTVPEISEAVQMVVTATSERCASLSREFPRAIVADGDEARVTEANRIRMREFVVREALERGMEISPDVNPPH